MNRLCTIIAVATFVALLPLASANGAHEVEPVAQEVDQLVTIDGKDSIEMDMFLDANDTLDFLVSTDDGTFYVDLHSHGEISGPTNHFQQNETSHAEASFTAPEEGTYSLYVINRGEGRIEVRLHVEGTFGIVGTSGFEVGHENGLPGPSLAAAAAGVVAVAWLARRR